MALNIRKAVEQDNDPSRDPKLPPRNGRGQPNIMLPDGSKRVAYTRTSSAGDVLEDKQGLSAWKARLSAIGAHRFPHVAADFSQITDIDDPEQKKLANSITEQLQELMGSTLKAMNGTRLHSLSEAVDRGDDVSWLSAKDRKVLDNYRRVVERMVVEHGYRVVHTEVFGVNDTLRVAGTPDRYGFVDDQLRVVDLKTSGSMEYSVGKFAMQMLGYAGFSLYNDINAVKGIDAYGLGVGREPILDGVEVDRTVGHIMWIPQDGSGGYFGTVDLTAAVEGYRLAEDLREWRNKWKRKAMKFTPSISV